MKFTVARATAVLGLIASSALIGWAPQAQADDKLPFTDASASGYIGICDASGKQITSGNIGTAPFARTVVSSVAAPQGYEAGIGRALLNVYQPRQGVDPGEWSGKGLTASTLYTGKNPMAQGTDLDPALVDFTSVFKPQWDGLVELRMYFTAPNKPQYTIPYPATVLKIEGTTWKVVGNTGPVSCTSGKAQSIEQVAIPKSVLTQPVNRSTPGVKAPSSSAPAGKATGTAKASGAASSGAATAPGSGSASDSSVNATPAASEKSSGGSGGTVWIIVLVVVAVAAGGAFAARRLGWFPRR